MTAACYGKLPLCSDFVTLGDVQGTFPVMREWLHAAFGAAQRMLPEGWDAAYRVAPMWRFAASAGVFSPHPVQGVLSPGVDRVGRWFPVLLIDDATDRAGWHEAAEALLLDVFSGCVAEVGQFVERMAQMGNGAREEHEIAESAPCSTLALVCARAGRASFWWTRDQGAGSPAFMREALPDGQDVAAMFGNAACVATTTGPDWNRFERPSKDFPWVVPAGAAALVLFGDKAAPMQALIGAASAALPHDASPATLHGLVETLHADIGRVVRDVCASGVSRLHHAGVAAIHVGRDVVTLAAAGQVVTRGWGEQRSEAIGISAPCAFAVMRTRGSEYHIQLTGDPVLGSGVALGRVAECLMIDGIGVGVVDAGCIVRVGE